MNTPIDLQSKTQSLERVISCMCISIMRANFEELQALFEVALTQFDLSDTTNRFVKALYSQPIETAAIYGHMDALGYLLPHSSFDTIDALTSAMSSKQWTALQALLPHYSAEQLEEAIAWATRNERWSAVEKITPAITQSCGSLDAILMEAGWKKKHSAMVALYPLCDPEAALQLGRNKNLSQVDLAPLIAYHSSEQQHQRLHSALGDVGVERRKAKI